MRCYHVTTDQGETYGVAATAKRDAMVITQDRLTSEGSGDRPARATDMGSWIYPYGTIIRY